MPVPKRWVSPSTSASRTPRLPDFGEGSFDLDRLAHRPARNLESRRLPASSPSAAVCSPGGLMLHLEIPRGRTAIEKFMHNWRATTTTRPSVAT
jgi:hypothetical protein